MLQLKLLKVYRQLLTETKQIKLYATSQSPKEISKLKKSTMAQKMVGISMYSKRKFLTKVLLLLY
jgi:hypothetical protein